MAEASTEGLRVFIYGSCVSRDAFELPGAPAPSDYVARSALGSAFSAAPTQAPPGLDLAKNPSPFQRRMVRLDMEKGLAALLREDTSDVVLIDLIDERLELVRTGSSFVTDSPEARACGVEHGPEQRIRVGSEEYFEAFGQGLAQLVSLAGPDRLLLNRVFWATKTSSGHELPNPEYIRRHNVALQSAYERLDAAGIRSISYDPGLFVTDPDHKWGPSPFHYGQALYSETLRELARLTG